MDKKHGLKKYFHYKWTLIYLYNIFIYLDILEYLELEILKDNHFRFHFRRKRMKRQLFTLISQDLCIVLRFKMIFFSLNQVQIII